MLSLTLRMDFLSFGKENFSVGLLRPFVGVNSDFFLIFAMLGTFKIIENIEFLTRMLRLLCAHMGQELTRTRARQELMHALSIQVRNWCVH
jgi:hypothetical protein